MAENAVHPRRAGAQKAQVWIGGQVLGSRPEHQSMANRLRVADQVIAAYDCFEKEFCDGKVGRLAKRVGMERTHLYRKLRDRGIEIKDRR